MVVSICGPNLLAAYCFYEGGKYYRDFKKCLYYCREATMAGINLNEYMNMKIVKRDSEKVIIKKSASFAEKYSNGGKKLGGSFVKKKKHESVAV